jgi:ABC-type branched-subunit amino acid transport system substrate-binding protein
MVGAAALAVAGCQGGIRRGPGPIGPDLSRPAEPNLVAVIVPLTGGDGPIGQSIANAANLALYDTGEKGIRLTAYDSAKDGAAAAAARAVGDGAGLILGPLLAEDVRAAAPIARRAGVPVLAFSNDEGVAGEGVFIMGFTPDQSIDRVVKLARDKGMARFGALIPTGLYGQRASRSMTGAVRRHGGQMVTVETFDRSLGATKAAAGRLKARGAVDAVLIADNGRIAALAAPVLPRAAKLMGTELWASDKTLGKTPALRGGGYAAAPDARFNQLVTRYRARYGKTPYRLGSLGYDAVLLAARGAKDWPAGRPFPVRSLIDRDGFAGVDGNFRFTRDGIAERLLEVRQVTPTGTTVVAPAGTAF